MERPAAPISIYSPILWRVIPACPIGSARYLSRFPDVSRPGLGAILNRPSFGCDEKGEREEREEEQRVEERREESRFHPAENRGVKRTWDIEFRAKLKKTKSVRKVVSGTPCVCAEQRQEAARAEATSPSRGNYGVPRWDEMPDDWPVPKENAARRRKHPDVQGLSRGVVRLISRESHVSALLCSAPLSPRRTSLPFSFV